MRSRIRSGLFAAACALAAVAGCATAPDAGMDKNKKYTTVCVDEAPTGSHIARLRCYRQVDADQRREQDRAQMEKIQYNSARPKIIAPTPGGGGGSRPLVLGSGSLVSAPSPGRAAR